MESKYLLFIFSILLISCSKSVFINNSKYGDSKFILYKNNIYKYTEKTNFSDFTFSGSYEINDSLIIFEYSDKNKLPYNYLVHDYKKIARYKETDFLLFQILDHPTNAPVSFVTIKAINASNLVIELTHSDFKGRAKIKRTNDIEYIEIEYIGYAKQRIFYDEVIDSELLIKMGVPKSGGSADGDCMIDYKDVLLEYDIKDRINMYEFTRSNVKFIKQ